MESDITSHTVAVTVALTLLAGRDKKLRTKTKKEDRSLRPQEADDLPGTQPEITWTLTTACRPSLFRWNLGERPNECILVGWESLYVNECCSCS
ncbi:hypothetical protein KQX54_002626 [Cotesia glomerata]|uniref:Uncharacterized protein n=1 Tax=Cotesia glomerata TaxID=32391 RepID=A0AAV7IKX4_COTGL|nr:hypothetical protein KQX54_002626 [Cotesia glomerata]